MPIVIFAVIILIFPFFVSFYASVQKNEKTLRFAITAFGITIFKFNAAFFKGEIYVNKSFKKPYKLKFAPDFSPKTMRKIMLFPKINKISVLSIRVLTRVGFDDNFFIPYAAVAINNFENAFFNCLTSKRPHLKIRNDLSFYQGKDMFEVFLRIRSVFNLADIIHILIGILSEKIYYAIGKK